MTSTDNLQRRYDRLRAHHDALLAALEDTTGFQFYRDGVASALEVAESVQMHAAWGPDATPDDGLKLGLDGVKEAVRKLAKGIEDGAAGRLPPSSPTPDGVIKERGEDAGQELSAIREMLLEGQGGDDGSRILPDFQEGMTVHAMVAACVHLLERRRDALDGYATANAEAPASTVQPPSSQESGVGEPPSATSRGEAPGRDVPEGWEYAAGLSNAAGSRWTVTLRRVADGHLVAGESVASVFSANAAACELARRAPALRLAEGCCSAVSPCSHQRRSPYTICDICRQAHSSAAPRPSQREG